MIGRNIVFVSAWNSSQDGIRFSQSVDTLKLFGALIGQRIELAYHPFDPTFKATIVVGNYSYHLVMVCSIDERYTE